jgi:peptidyl-prolyl cis-trans isomerase A (cyclophilin A)
MIRLLCGLLLTTVVFAQTPLSAPPADEAMAKGRKAGLYCVLDTSMGVITVQLFEKESPETVRNFVDLAMGKKPWRDPKSGEMKQTPFYDGTVFHRVIPNFMVQGGEASGTGTGGVGFTVPDEWNHSSLEFNIAGRVAMANSGPKTASTQFFITIVKDISLAEKHTIFGQVVDGMNVAYKIAGVPRDPADKPRTPVVLQSVKVFRVGPEPGQPKAKH